jgi:hypothetical protein
MINKISSATIKRVLFFIGWIFIFYYLAKNYHAIVEYGWTVKPFYIVVCLFLLFLSSLVYVYKIFLLSRPVARISLTELLLSITKANFLKYIPGGVWNHIGIFVELNSHVLSRSVSANLVLINILLTVTSALAFTYRVLPVYIYLPLAMVGFSFFFILSKLLKKTRGKIKYKHFKKVINYLIKQPTVIFYSLLTSILYFILHGTAFAFFLLALTPNRASVTSITSIMHGYILSWLAGFLFLPAPAGIGVREFVLTRLIKALPSASVMVSISVLFRIFIILKDTLLFIFLTIFLKNYKMRTKQTKVIASETS